MDTQPSHPIEPNPSQELSEPLRRAVEQVRNQAPPAGSMDRAVERAGSLPPPPRPRRWGRRSLLAAGLAASLLVGLAIYWHGPLRQQGASSSPGTGEFARAQPEPSSTEKSIGQMRAEPDLTNTDLNGLNESLDRGDSKNGQDRPGTGKDGQSGQGEGQKADTGKGEGKDQKAAFDDQTVNKKTEDAAPGKAPADPAQGQGGKPDDSRSKSHASGGREEKEAAPGGPVPTANRPSNADERDRLEQQAESSGRAPAPPASAAPVFQREAQGRPGEGGGASMPGGMPGMPSGPGGGPPQRRSDPRANIGRGLSAGRGEGRSGEGERDRDEASVERLREAQQAEATELRRLEELAPRAAMDSRVLEEQRARLQRVEERLKKALARKDGADKSKESERAKDKAGKLGGSTTLATRPEEKKPVVWHRDRAQPTFARVYVGDGNALDLVSLQVTVTVEGPRARTVVDHIFRNPHPRQLEGTFEYPMPSGASPSYFAMFLGQTRDTLPARFGRRGDTPNVPADALASLRPEDLVRQVDTTDWGRLQEARIVSREKALETYEEVVRGRIDPALMEYAGGNTFRGRVFPIPPRGYNRVILAYEELLPIAGDRMVYRFPLPGCKLHDMSFNLQARAEECSDSAVVPKDAHKETSGGHRMVSRKWNNTAPEGEVIFSCRPAQPEVQAITGRPGENGPHYAYARVRPPLKEAANDQPFAGQAVFLLDTSLSEHPDRFAVSMKLLEKILAGDKTIRQFNILAFNVGAAWVEPKGWLPNTPEGRKTALSRLDGLVLEGATDVSSALEKLVHPGFEAPAGTPLDCFLLSDGHITWGESDVASLVARFEQRCPFSVRFHCYRTGLGEENQELYEALTRRGGGIFQCYGEADVPAAARAHRSVCMQVERVRFVGGPAASDVLVAGRRAAVYPGGELVVTARFQGTGRTTMLVEGKYRGKPVIHEFPLDVRSTSELAPRGWAEVVVSSLLALHDSKLDSLVTAYCQQFGIVSRTASFLVLENDTDYKRFRLEEERGRSVDGDLGDFISKMWQQMGKAITARESFARFLAEVERRVPLSAGPQGAHVARMLALMHDADFETTASSIEGGLVHKKGLPAEYLALVARDRRNVHPYLTEARRRAEAGDVNGAMRVLSSVVEVHPERSDALRLVGYRLLDLKQAAQAVRLFEQVRRQRPFEPHSYRDLARALEESGHYALAALQYEIILAGNWHNRFRESLKTVAQEEYARMMQEAIRKKAVGNQMANHFGERLEHMSSSQPQSDLRVTISWNTDATDVDLWVIEPDGTKCFFQHQHTQSGGELSQDQTQGYGPERYHIRKARPGTYTIVVHYFAANPNLLAGETHVNVSIVKQAGSPKETEQRHTIILKHANEQVEVGKIKF